MSNRIEIVKALKDLGYGIIQASSNSYYHMLEIGDFKVYIYITNVVKVVIEVKKPNSNISYLRMKEDFLTFNDFTVEKIIEMFNTYCTSCEAFTNAVPIEKTPMQIGIELDTLETPIRVLVGLNQKEGDYAVFCSGADVQYAKEHNQNPWIDRAEIKVVRGTSENLFDEEYNLIK